MELQTLRDLYDIAEAMGLDTDTVGAMADEHGAVEVYKRLLDIQDVRALESRLQRHIEIMNGGEFDKRITTLIVENGKIGILVDNGLTMTQLNFAKQRLLTIFNQFYGSFTEIVVWVDGNSALRRLREHLNSSRDDQEYIPYYEYLQSDHWQETRQQALDRAGNACQLCKSTDRLDVHHNTYERLGRELPQDLIVLCHDCHGRFHHKMDAIA